MKKEYAFDIQLTCAICVMANSEEEAREMLAAQIDCASANLGAWPDGDPIMCEVSLDAYHEPELYAIDGEGI